MVCYKEQVVLVKKNPIRTYVELCSCKIVTNKPNEKTCKQLVDVAHLQDGQISRSSWLGVGLENISSGDLKT